MPDYKLSNAEKTRRKKIAENTRKMMFSIPVIATSRIDNYDGENVTFHYNRHEDNELITETVSAIDFIKAYLLYFDI